MPPFSQGHFESDVLLLEIRLNSDSRSLQVTLHFSNAFHNKGLILKLRPWTLLTFALRIIF